MMDEDASTTDGLGFVDPDDASGASAEPLMESSPGTAAAAAAAAGLEVVSARNREGDRDRLNQLQREAKHTRRKTSRRQPKPFGAIVFGPYLFSAENLSKHHVWYNINRCLWPLFRFLNPCPTFSVSRLHAVVCPISAHSCPSYISLASAFFPFFLV